MKNASAATLHRSISAFVFAAGLAALLAASPVRAQQDTYEIKLFRPSKVGDRYRLEATGSQRREALVHSANGETRREGLETFTVELKGEVETVLVDSQGNATAASVKVISLLRVDGGRRDEILSPETRIVERRTGARQVFEIEGRAVPPQLKDVLDAVLSETNDPGAPSDDELMGTKERKKAGERWPVSREALARFVSADEDLALEVTPADIEGDGVLTGIERCGTVDCARIDIAVSIAAAPRGGKLPLSAPEKAKVEIKVSSLLPVDTRLQERAETTNFRMSVRRRFTNSDGSELTAEAIVEQRTERRLTPLD